MKKIRPFSLMQFIKASERLSISYHKRKAIYFQGFLEYFFALLQPFIEAKVEAIWVQKCIFSQQRSQKGMKFFLRHKIDLDLAVIRPEILYQVVPSEAR